MLSRYILPLALVLAAPAALADWQLDNGGSSVDFISVKKSTVGEVHHFKQLSGTITEGGDASVDIDLASVETNIPIRNERLQKLLFETAKFPKASIHTSVDAKKLKAMQAGETFVTDADLTLSLHNSEKTLKTRLRVVKLAGDRLQVSTADPIILHAGDYGLAQGVEKLREIAGLPSISPVVPVVATLVFDHK
ncbi:YceI family protein [Microbulbifer sp. SAOS-129_SWC]|uniref:YceI family protein n=1 Tax=Microbulbifer sp. SAOS-129_SWC TaxID=3145235 RepID=UPI00321763C2